MNKEFEKDVIDAIRKDHPEVYEDLVAKVVDVIEKATERFATMGDGD